MEFTFTDHAGQQWHRNAHALTLWKPGKYELGGLKADIKLEMLKTKDARYCGAD
ncbi:hypothetical protein [Streptomyces sp. URMC 128]|uniref:hypothetical protein n=1 Tax=Streptomyces sp. URMC 128 TaxID=3423404 RepID=UPI003F533772